MAGTLYRPRPFSIGRPPHTVATFTLKSDDFLLASDGISHRLLKNCTGKAFPDISGQLPSPSLCRVREGYVALLIENLLWRRHFRTFPDKLPISSLRRVREGYVALLIENLFWRRHFRTFPDKLSSSSLRRVLEGYVALPVEKSLKIPPRPDILGKIAEPFASPVSNGLNNRGSGLLS